MKKKPYKFVVVLKKDGQLDSDAYPKGLSYTPGFSGAALVVYREFPDDETARAQAVSHKDGHSSEVWMEYCPPLYRTGASGGGMDVYYIGPLSEEEEQDVRQSFFKVLFHHKEMTSDIFDTIVVDGPSKPDKPSERELGLFSKDVEAYIKSYKAMFG